MRKFPISRLVSFTLAVFISLVGFCQSDSEESDFVGVLSYELNTHGRVWGVEYSIGLDVSRTDILLNGQLFQSILKKEGEVYLIDVLGKKILPTSRLAGGSDEFRPPSPNGERSEPPQGIEHDKPAEGSMPPGDVPQQRKENINPTVLIKEEMLWGHPGKTLQIEMENRVAEFSGITGFPAIPRSFYMQFEELQPIADSLVKALKHHQLIPVEVYVTGQDETVVLSLILKGIEAREVDASVFEIPSNYAMIFAPGRGGPGRSSPDGQKKGPPPGGSRSNRGGPPAGGGGF